MLDFEFVEIPALSFRHSNFNRLFPSRVPKIPFLKECEWPALLVTKKSAFRERSQFVIAVCLHVVVTDEKLRRQGHFQVLEQKVLLGNCSTTTLTLMRRCVHNNCRSGSTRRCLTILPIVPILFSATVICSKHLKRFLGFPQS
ncbi:hypothetical protein AVEN_108315-1 [Araneus ventricosus]|uniref:Uncharacterized protein n=1 Tax=Araneus ventricosus TaxID=182803 RepID=A0A4Y2M4T2_ARAVE|nr:hypothetical protein AVEN_108315-1 [Araneus ventricosus]